MLNRLIPGTTHLDYKNFGVFSKRLGEVAPGQRPKEGGKSPGGFAVAAAASGRGELPTASGGSG